MSLSEQHSESRLFLLFSCLKIRLPFSEMFPTEALSSSSLSPMTTFTPLPEFFPQLFLIFLNRIPQAGCSLVAGTGC